jgi:hypothetical protein
VNRLAYGLWFRTLDDDFRVMSSGFVMLLQAFPGSRQLIDSHLAIDGIYVSELQMGLKSRYKLRSNTRECFSFYPTSIVPHET